MNLILQKVRAAETLPEMLTIYNREKDDGVCWKDTDRPVATREWLAVMHEAEKRLSFAQRYPYIKRLGYDEGRVWDGGFNGLDAGWELRLEAYVRAIGRWEATATNKEENAKDVAAAETAPNNHHTACSPSPRSAC